MIKIKKRYSHQLIDKENDNWNFAWVFKKINVKNDLYFCWISNDNEWKNVFEKW